MAADAVKRGELGWLCVGALLELVALGRRSGETGEQPVVDRAGGQSS